MSSSNNTLPPTTSTPRSHPKKSSSHNVVSSSSSFESSSSDEDIINSTKTVPRAVSFPLPPKKRKIYLDIIPNQKNSTQEKNLEHDEKVQGNCPLSTNKEDMVSSDKDQECKKTQQTVNTKKVSSQSKQNKYVPETPMTKEEMTAWRKEARKVRNRQSAAASREKIRNRIKFLEGKVDEWKTKYEEVEKRLQLLEKECSNLC